MLYRRPYYNADLTAEALEVLPPWMKMRINKASVGWQYMNALFGVEAQLMDEALEVAKDNQYLPTGNIFEPANIFKIRHDIAQAPLGSNVSAVASGNITLIEADDLYTFFEAAPTRLTTGVITTFPTLSDTILGATLVVDYDPSGAWLMRDGNNHLAYIINRDISTANYSKDQTIVFNEDLKLIYTYNFGRTSQGWEITGTDEILNFSSGSYTLQHTPIEESLQILDILNLDPSGNATLVSPLIYTLVNDRIEQSEYSQTNIVPSGWKSSYIVEYDHLIADRMGPITTTETYWDVQRWNQVPVIATVTVDNDLGVSVPFSTSVSEDPIDTVALRVRPDLWRPGATGWVEFSYSASSSGIWASDLVEFTTTPGDDPNFVFLDPMFAVRVIDDVTTVDRGTYNVRASGANNRQIFIDPIGSGLTNLDVIVKYKAAAEIPASSVQAVSSADVNLDKYPKDIFITDGIISPYTIIPITSTSGVIDDALASADEIQFTVHTWQDYDGVAYNPNGEDVWFIDNNNQQVHIYDAQPLVLRERRDLYGSSGARVTVNPTGTTTTYPFDSKDLDTNRTAGAAVIKGDFLFVVDGTNLHIMNVFDQEMNIVDTFTVPANIEDLAINTNGNLLAAIGSGLTELELHHDYFMVDNAKGITYYRENYGFVDVSGVRDV